MSLTVADASPRTDIRGLALTNRRVVDGLSALFLLPTALFALSLRPLPACMVVAGCCGALALVARAPGSASGLLGRRIDGCRLALAVLAAAALLVIGGEMHLFFAPADWQVRDAVLADLVRSGLPVGYVIDGTRYVLRAPLGMYLVPAYVGHAFGLGAAHVAMFVQNTLCLGSIFYLLALLGAGWRHLASMIAFAGLPVLACLLRSSLDGRSLVYYLEWHLDGWHPFLQYTSSVVQFVWVPNHALPGWFLAVLMILEARRAIDVATLGVSVAGLCFWSPLAVLAALPWLLYRVASDPSAVLGARRVWIGAALGALFAPVAVYLVAASGTISHGTTAVRDDFLFWYVFFVVVQLPALAFVAWFRRRVPRDLRALMVVNGLWLLVLPFFSFGPHNDLVMRGSIPSLTILAFVYGLVLLDLIRSRSVVGTIVGGVLVLLALPSAVMEIRRALIVPRYAISDCSLLQASHDLGDYALPSNYVAAVASIPSWLLDAETATAAPLADKACWPDLEPRVDPDRRRPVVLNRN